MKHIECAIEAARKAGAVHAKHFETNFRISTKSSSYDLVTDADTEAEKEVVSVLRRDFHDYNILAEENHYPATDSPYRWVIDPLDGTNNFACRLPIFCVSIALMCQDEVILGVIYDVSRDELFTAEKGQGAFLNGKPIRVSPVKDLQEGLLITGFYYSRGPEMEETLNDIRKFFQSKIRGLRRLGAAALDLCYIACGRASGFWEFELSPWDYAAGMCIVHEAGGKVTNKEGGLPNPRKKSYLVASNAHIHDSMLRILR
ncbi:MAG: inositol monophosphatase [Candidatus Omnitrophica bacterium]|nr:inositol monophosphatase [Candidatus Omnitrophota bacterium]